MFEHIVSDPAILGGKPCIRGTRISVEFVRELVASGASRDDIAAAYPELTPDLVEEALSFTDRSSIQAVLDTVARLELAGRISHQRATIVLRACSIATRNFDRTLDTLNGPRPQQHDWYHYFDKVQSLLATIDPLLDEATEHDAAALDSPSIPPSPAGSGEGARG